MSRMLSLVAGVALFALSVQPAAAQQHGAKIVDDAWIAAAKAGDVDAAVALYAPDATMFDVGGEPFHGTAAIRAHYQEWFGAVTITDVQLNATYVSSGDLSVGYGVASLTFTPKAGGSPQTMTARVTSAANKINGKWLYVVDHASAPAKQ